MELAATKHPAAMPGAIVVGFTPPSLEIPTHAFDVLGGSSKSAMYQSSLHLLILVLRPKTFRVPFELRTMTCYRPVLAGSP